MDNKEIEQAKMGMEKMECDLLEQVNGGAGGSLFARPEEAFNWLKDYLSLAKKSNCTCEGIWNNGFLVKSAKARLSPYGQVQLKKMIQDAWDTL